MRKTTSTVLLLLSFWLVAPTARAEQPPPAGTPLQTGGLAPPALGTGPTPPPTTRPSTTRSDLERADEEDAGRGLEWAFVGVEGGGAWVGLGGKDELVPGDARGFGPTFGASVGGRLLYFTAGPHFRMVKLPGLSLLTIDLEAGFRVPLGRLEPHVEVGGGYARVGGAGGETRIDGFDGRLGGGIDYYATNTFSIGAALSAALLHVSRGAVAGAADPVWQRDSSKLGACVSAAAVAALHF
jgi:hypothetical protein